MMRWNVLGSVRVPIKGSVFCLAVLALLLGGAGQAKAGLLWYSGDSDGIASLINQNNVQSYNIVYNGFNVTGSGWYVGSVWSNDVFQSGPPVSTTATWAILSNLPTGTLVASGDGVATLTTTGFTFEGFPEYQVLVSGLSVYLAPGTYWLAVYPDNTNGGIASKDTTSGANAVGTSPGANYVSTDGGNTFLGPTGNTGSAGIEGVATAAPEPASLTLLGIGIPGIAGYGWRRRKLAA